MCPFCQWDPERADPCPHAVFDSWVDSGERGMGDSSYSGPAFWPASNSLNDAMQEMLLLVFGAPHPDYVSDSGSVWNMPEEAAHLMAEVGGQWPGGAPPWFPEIGRRILDEVEEFGLDEDGKPTGATTHFDEGLHQRIVVTCVRSVAGLDWGDFEVEDVPLGHVAFAADPETARMRISGVIERCAADMRTAVDRVKQLGQTDSTD